MVLGHNRVGWADGEISQAQEQDRQSEEAQTETRSDRDHQEEEWDQRQDKVHNLRNNTACAGGAPMGMNVRSLYPTLAVGEGFMPSRERAGINPAPTVGACGRRPRNTGDFLGNGRDREDRFRNKDLSDHLGPAEVSEHRLTRQAHNPRLRRPSRLSRHLPVPL